MTPQDPQRLRQPPEERFAGPYHQFDLASAAGELRKEAVAGFAHHRQKSLYKHGPTSISLFIFDAQARLAPHRTKGTVIIQLVKGHLTITAGGQAHDLKPGNLLVLATGVEHDVVAQEESEMLLTVQLDPRPTSA